MLTIHEGQSLDEQFGVLKDPGSEERMIRAAEKAIFSDEESIISKLDLFLKDMEAESTNEIVFYTYVLTCMMRDMAMMGNVEFTEP